MKSFQSSILIKKTVSKHQSRGKMKCFRWPILYGNNGCSKHYSFQKLFLGSYLENAVGSAMKWKAINNQIMQWKTINRADKANLLSKHFWVLITIQNTKYFFVCQPWWLTFFQGLFLREGIEFLIWTLRQVAGMKLS